MQRQFLARRRRWAAGRGRAPFFSPFEAVHPRRQTLGAAERRDLALEMSGGGLSVPGRCARHDRPLTLANSVLPVPGGPYMRMFLYRLWFFLVFLVAMAMSRTRASRLGCQGTRWLSLEDAWLPSPSLQTAWASFFQAGLEGAPPTPRPALQPTYTEDHALQGVLRLAEQPPADLRGQAVEVTCTVHSAAPERGNSGLPQWPATELTPRARVAGPALEGWQTRPPVPLGTTFRVLHWPLFSITPSPRPAGPVQPVGKHTGGRKPSSLRAQLTPTSSSFSYRKGRTRAPGIYKHPKVNPGDSHVNRPIGD